MVVVIALVLVLTAPANNWDSLTYHLSRVAAWMQHGGVYRIPNAPTPRMNEYQPLAEQQILYLFVAAGSGALFALPQYLAQLAILVAVYGAARRLGFEPRAAVCSALLLATFSLVAFESTTSQNDLVAASFPIAAACLLLGNGRFEPALAGVAVGLGLGAKLTTAPTGPNAEPSTVRFSPPTLPSGPRTGKPPLRASDATRSPRWMTTSGERKGSATTTAVTSAAATVRRRQSTEPAASTAATAPAIQSSWIR